MNQNPKNCVCGHPEIVHWPSIRWWTPRPKRTYCTHVCPCTQYQLAKPIDELEESVGQLAELLPLLERRSTDREASWNARCALLVREVETERGLKDQALERVAALEQELAALEVA